MNVFLPKAEVIERFFDPICALTMRMSTVKDRKHLNFVKISIILSI